MNTFKAEAITAMVRRGLYGKGMRRTPLLKAITGLLAVQMFFLGMAPAAWASDLGDIFNANAVDGKLPGGRTYTGGGATFMDGSENGGSGVEISGTGTTIFRTSGHWDVTGGSLSSAGWVYLLAGGGITFSGGSFNVDGLVAAAMNGFSFGTSYSPDAVTGSIEGSAGGSGSRVYIGQTVGASSGTIVATDGMSADSSFSIASGGGKITFKGEMGANSRLKAGTVDFQDVDGETKSSADGEVDAGDDGTVSGDFTQKGGSVNANEISGTLTQEGGQANATTISSLEQKSGNGQATAITIGSLNQTASGATATAGEVTGNATVAGALNGKDGSLTVGSLTQQGGNVAANGALTIRGEASQTAGSINASGVTLATAGANVSLNQAGNSLGTVSGNAGAVTVNNAGALTLGTINASSLSATTTGAGANITQSGATTITGSGDVTLNAGANAIDLSQGVTGAGALTLRSSSTAEGAVKVSGGTVSAQSITMGGSTKTLSQTAGQITISGTDFLTTGDTLAQSGGSATFNSSAAAVSQSGNGTINATTLSGAVTQSGGKISGRNGGDLTIANLATQTGEIDASGATLTLAGGSTLGGTVKAGDIALSGTGAKTLTQDGANSAITVSGGSFLASGNKFTQNSGTLTLSNSGGNTVNANVTQEDGVIRSQNGALTFATAVDKNAGTIGVSGQNVTFSGDVTQSGSGKIVGATVTANGNIADNTGIEATSLALGKADQAYTLDSENNKISTLSGSAASVSVNNGANDIVLKVNVGTAVATVTAAKDVTLDGVTAGRVVIENATGQVKDTANQGATTVALGDAGFSKTVGSVLLKNGTGAITVEGINATGDVGIQNASITQNGAISGKNVTLDQTDDAGTLAVINDITATGDILVRSANAVEVGDSDHSPTLSANGNIVVKGQNAIIGGREADNRTLLSANAIGVEATAGDVTIEKANFVADDGVALKSSGNLALNGNVAMGKTTAGETDASLVVYADGNIDADFLGDNRPADNLTIAKGTLGLSSDSANPTEIKLNRFAYKTDSTDDIYVKFSGAEIGLEGQGNVSVDSTRADGVTIVAGSSSLGGNGTTVEAKDATATSGTVKDKVEIGNSSGDDNFAGGLIASGEGKTVNLDPVGSVTVASGAKISSNADLTLETLSGKTFYVNEGGTVESTAGNVSITSRGQLTVSGTVQANASGKDVTLKTIGNNTPISVSGTAKAANTLDIDAGMVAGPPISITESGTAQAKTIVLHDQSDLNGIITAEKIDADDNVIRTSSSAKTITVTGADGIKASQIDQKGGTIKAAKIDAPVTQQGTGAKITGVADDGNGSVEITRLTQQPDGGGTVDVGTGTLTLRDDSTSAGTINADKIVVQAADNTLKNLEQDGAGTITVTGADGIKADKVVQSSTGTIKADKIDAALTQSGAATAKANAADGTITVVGALTQSAQNATVGAAGQNVTLEGGATQQGHGKVLADTLTLAGDNASANVYTLTSTEGNAVSRIDGTAKSVAIYDGTADTATDLTLQVNVGTGDDNTIAVLKAGNVTLDGVTAKNIAVNEAGDVTDTENQTAATTVALGFKTPEISKTVDNVMLKNGSGAVTIEGIYATGDVGIQNDSITQNGEIVGKNVTLDQTAAAGMLTIGQDITATGGTGEREDILIRSAGAVKVGGDGTAPTLVAEKGNIVVKGTGVNVEGTSDIGASFKAKAIGVEATDGDVTLKHADFIATDENADGVVLKSSGDMTITDVKAGKTAGAKDAQVTISAGETLYMATDDQPTDGKNLAVSAAKLGDIDVTAGDTVDFNSFVYTHNDTDKPDLNFKFTGKTLSLLNEKGKVTVTTDGQPLNIVQSSATGNDDVKVEARDVTAATANTMDFVQIAGSDPAGSKGIVAQGNIEVNGSAGAGTVTVKGTVSSTSGTVSLTSGGAIEVAAVDGAVETLTAGMGVMLETVGTGDNAKDITIAGTVASKGATTINSAKDAILSGTVDTSDTLEVTAANDAVLSGRVTSGAATITAGKNVRQTGGTITAIDKLDLTATAGNISQTAGSVSAGGAATAKAGDGSVTLAQPQNDFQNGLDVTAKKAVNVYDRTALTLSVTDKTTGGIRAQAGQTLFVTGDIDAGGNVTLLAGNHMTAENVTAAGTVTATATANGAVFSGDVEGASVAITATGAELETQKVTAKNGNATLTGGSVTANDAVSATADAIIHATDGAATALGTVSATRDATVAADGGAATTAGSVTAGRDATIRAGNGAATVSGGVQAGRNATVTGTSGTTTVSGAPMTAANNVTVSGGNGAARIQSAVTANGGNVRVTGASVTTTAGGTLKASAGNVILQATRGAATVGGQIDARDVAIDATTGIIENAPVNATRAATARTTGGNIAINASSSAPTAVYRAENGNIVIGAEGALSGNNLGLRGNTIQNNGAITVNNSLALETVGDVTYDDNSLPAGVANLGIRSTGNVIVESSHALVANGATVSANAGAGIRQVEANGIESTEGTVEVTTAGNLTASAVTGAQGTTVTANGGGAVNVTGNLGEGGDTIVTADGLESGTLAGGNATLNIGGAANVGTLAVDGDLNGTVNGQFTTAGGNVGSIGQEGDGFTAGDVEINGDLTSNGNATIAAASIAADGTTLTVHGDLSLDVTGEANVGALEVDGDMNGEIDGPFTTAGGNVGSIGQQGGFTTGAATINGDLTSNGNATIAAASIVADGTTLTVHGDLSLDEVTGEANVGTLEVDGDLNGTVNGQFTTAGGNVGSIGLQGGFNAGGTTINGPLTSAGAVTITQGGAVVLNGALSGGNVNIAGASITGGGLLTATALTLAMGGNIGTGPENRLQVNTANLLNINGGQIYLTDTSAGPVALNIIDGTGNVDLQFAGPVTGGGTITAGGDLTIRTDYRFGDLLQYGGPVNVVFGGMLHIYGVNADATIPLLHIVVGGDFDPSTFSYNFGDNGGFAVRYYNGAYQIVDPSPDKMRLINRALAFTVNTPELKSKQGVFGEPNMIHTKMSVSEARSLANMDMLSLSAVDFRKTWEGIRSKEGTAALRKWGPRVYPNQTPLKQKLESVASEMETQPEIWVPGQDSAPVANGQ